jgi:membrane protease YdiL (CAAX protease family)
MRGKTSFLILGLVTLLVFPLPALWALNYFEDLTILEVLELDDVFTIRSLIGLEFGVFYALLVIIIGQAPVFDAISEPQERILKSLHLNWADIIFISFCAGFGEEILFRAGIQTWLGPWWTSIFFIAVHGYFNPKSWRKSLYGLILLPFILILAYGYEFYGLWFCIAAHFSYDLVLFSTVISKRK